MSFPFRSPLAIACCLLVLLAAGGGRAQTGPAPREQREQREQRDDVARVHHDAGRAHGARGRHEAAIAEYRKAYELRADPSYLLDIAESYRALQVSERAVFFYRRYLSAHPAPPNRPEVEAQIALLQPGGPTSPLSRAVDPSPSPSPSPPAGASAPGADRPGLDLGLDARMVPEGDRPVTGRWWFWAAVGALAAAGATVAILAAGKREDQAPATALGNVKLF